MRDAIVIVTLFCFIWTPTLAIAGQHDEGIAAGKAANTVILGTINQTSASTVVPGYTATPPETAYRGQAKLPTLGNAHLADCATRVNDPVCEAQRGAVLSANTPRPAITAYDPAVVSAKDIARNPSLVLGSLAAYYSGCSTSEVIKPASMESKLCKRTSGVETVRCGRTLTIAVDRKTAHSA